MHSHFITKCSCCDTVIAQCRCIDTNKTVLYELCITCRQKEQSTTVNDVKIREKIVIPKNFNWKAFEKGIKEK